MLGKVELWAEEAWDWIGCLDAEVNAALEQEEEDDEKDEDAEEDEEDNDGDDDDEAEDGDDDGDDVSVGAAEREIASLFARFEPDWSVEKRSERLTSLIGKYGHELALGMARERSVCTKCCLLLAIDGSISTGCW